MRSISRGTVHDPSTHFRNAGAGAVLGLIRAGAATTRAEIADVTGLARSTVGDRLDLLIDDGLVVEREAARPSSGRPPRKLEFNAAAGVMLVTDLAETHARLAALDLGGVPLAERWEPIAAGAGPTVAFTVVSNGFAALLSATGRLAGDVRGIGVGVPAPVEFPTGNLGDARVPRWTGFSVCDWFGADYPAPVFVDRRANLMARAERQIWRCAFDDLLFISFGAEIACGVVAGGQVMRGALGAAGDLGHLPVPGHGHIDCPCGGSGCLEAVAGDRAVAAALAREGRRVTGIADVAELVNRGDPVAIRTLREAARHLGDVLAYCVSLFNPAVIAMAGVVGAAQHLVLAAVRERITRHAAPLATYELEIVASRLGERAAVVGGALMVEDQIFAPDAIDRALLNG